VPGRPRAIFALALATLAAGWFLAGCRHRARPAAPPLSDDQLAQLAHAMGGPLARLDPATRPAAEWAQLPYGLRLRGERYYLRPVPAAAVYQAGRSCVVREQRADRWLFGAYNPASQVVETWAAFDGFDALHAAVSPAPLPTPPAPFKLREVARLPEYVTRVASNGRGKTLYVLALAGNVYRVDVATSAARLHIPASSYLHRYNDVPPSCLGLTLDDRNRLYIVANQQDDSIRPIQNRVTIFRTTDTEDDDPIKPRPWLTTSYPHGINAFNHGVGHIAEGPDGLLYVGSGSRTDANEPGDDPRYSKEGETPLTSCIWRLNPDLTSQPRIEVFARGLRNPFGFCWDDDDNLFATDNGPNADPPDELNLVQEGRHYGFPYVFSNWPHKPYPHTPDPPPGVQFAPPIPNVGPHAGGTPLRPMSTFDPHSSASGIVCLGDDFPPEYRGTFLVARFGNLIDLPTDVGFDLLWLRLRENAAGAPEAQTRRFLAPLARPTDLHHGAPGKIFITEHMRQTNTRDEFLGLPGRILELSVDPPPAP